MLLSGDQFPVSTQASFFVKSKIYYCLHSAPAKRLNVVSVEWQTVSNGLLVVLVHW